jgi:hypothetical protein
MIAIRWKPRSRSTGLSDHDGTESVITIDRNAHLKARLLLEADISEAGEGWSDRRIVAAWTPACRPYCADAPTPGRRRSRSGAAPQAVSQLRQAAHIRRCGGDQTDRPGLFGSPRGRAKRTLHLLEDKVVELNIVPRASDNTIGRTLKKRSQAAPAQQFVIPPPGLRRGSSSKCGVRGEHGRCAGGLSQTPRSCTTY